MKTVKELELSLIVKEAMIQQLKYRLSMYIEKCTMYENSNIDFIERITKAIELLKKYNDKENNYYVPVDNCIDILKGVDKK